MSVSKSRKIPSNGTAPAKKAAPVTGAGLALYHVVYAHETFDDAAEMLLQIVQTAARDFSSKPRHLFLDIEGHRTETGAFDPDMYELQNEFVMRFLGRWLTTVAIPLLNRRYQRTRQYEDVPDHLTIHEGGPSADLQENLAEIANANGQPIYPSEVGDLVNADGSRTKRPTEDED